MLRHARLDSRGYYSFIQWHNYLQPPHSAAAAAAGAQGSEGRDPVAQNPSTAKMKWGLARTGGAHVSCNGTGYRASDLIAGGLLC